MRNRPRNWLKKNTRPTSELRNITGNCKKNMKSAKKSADIVKRNVCTKKKMIGVIERKIVADYTKKAIVLEMKKIDDAMNKHQERLNSSILTLLNLRPESTQ